LGLDIEGDQMKGMERRVIDLRSQDLEISDLEKFKETVSGSEKEERPEELIMFSSNSKPYQFNALSDFMKEMDSVPNDASYFYFTLTYHGGERCSLYLDPDRPGKVVVEGPQKWAEMMENRIHETFPKGSERFRVHQKYGILMIWGIVVLLAGVILALSSLIFGLDPLVYSVVIFTSSILGIYLSIVKSKELQPANTISFVKKRKYWFETLLHLITVALGIICAILVTVLVKGFF
jgi:hypothetical protein